MDVSGQPVESSRRTHYLWLLGLVIVAGGLFLVAAGSWGLWEPWETEYARMARALAEPDGSWVVPHNAAGEPVNKPWLLALLLEWGFRLSRNPSGLARLPFDALALLLAWPIFGLARRRWSRAVAASAGLLTAGAVIGLGYGLHPSEEFWLRLPLAACGLLTVVVTFATLRLFTAPHRAGITALILTASPAFLLSAVNLGGAMPMMATTTAALCAFFVGLHRRSSWPFWVFTGVLTGASVWAGGVTGAVLVLGTMACYGLWSLSRSPRRLVGVVPIAVISLVAAATLTYPVVRWIGDGFAETKDVLGVLLPLGLALTVVVASLWSDALKPLRGWGFVLLLGTAALVVAIPMSRLVADRGWEDSAKFLLYNDFLTRRTLPDHVTFDWLIRQLGFAAYPFTTFLPLAFAYLLQTVTPQTQDDASDRQEASQLNHLKVFIACWLVLGIVVVGLTATLSRHYLFVGLTPLAAATGLLLTDLDYWRKLRQNRTVLYLLGAACLAVLLVLTKDLKTRANPDLGQLGPEVLFEFLLHDGRVPFPVTYHLPLVDLFGVIWSVAIALFFWMLLSWIVDLPQTVRDWRRRRAERGEDEREGLLVEAVMKGVELCGVALAFIVRPLGPILRPIRPVFESTKGFVVIIMVSMVAFAGVTAGAYMPRLSDHLSNRGLIDTYRALAKEGETIYRVGATRGSANYYLGDDTIEVDSGSVNPIDSIRSVGELRAFFCQPDERMWALLDRDSLAQAYYEVRRGDEAAPRRRSNPHDCDPDRNLWVLDARSSRYVLISNRLEAGEENQSPIAENVFEEPPEGLLSAAHDFTFDGKLRLVGYRVLDEDGNMIDEAEVNQTVYLETFFEVLDRVPSARQMFIHVDYGNNRINGDHDPVGGEFPLNYWVPGEIVRDRYPLKIDRGSNTGDYTIMIGFFSGDSRMEVRPATGDNRVPLGTIHIRGGI